MYLNVNIVEATSFLQPLDMMLVEATLLYCLTKIENYKFVSNFLTSYTSEMGYHLELILNKDR